MQRMADESIDTRDLEDVVLPDNDSAAVPLGQLGKRDKARNGADEEQRPSEHDDREARCADECGQQRYYPDDDLEGKHRDSGGGAGGA